MSIITKEQAKDLRNAFECWQQDYDPAEDKEQYDMFGLGIVAMDALLASLEKEAVEFLPKNLDRALTILGVALPVSKEEFNLESERWMQRLIDRVMRLESELVPPAQANAEPVAWLWSHRKHPSEVTLVRPEDDEKAEAAHWSGWSCKALYAAPPAPVVDADDNFYSWFGREWHEHYQQNQYTTAAKQMLGVMAESAWKAGRRAAMLQSAEPLTTGCKLPELTDSQCLEFLAVAFRHNRIKGDIEFDDIRLGLKMALKAAPRQEVKS
ncbi:hypothetical protein MX657_09245 [Enterobacter chuandaensis]|uniref:hypothetical protein n=1 Tax=Enterobacter chuandaensis TaxID=2497875 RepID=UPI003216FAAB